MTEVVPISGTESAVPTVLSPMNGVQNPTPPISNRRSGSGYVELHTRSAFSFLEGASLPEALIARAAEFDHPAVALLDRDNLSGAVRFHKAAKKMGLRALIG